MIEVCCSSCRGTGKVSQGTISDSVDPNFDFTKHGRPERAEEYKQFMLSLKPGDVVETSGNFLVKVHQVGMYDGWPHWKPIPAISYFGPLGVDHKFYYDLWPRIVRHGHEE